MAFLTKGIWIAFRTSAADTRQVNYYFEGGIKSFVRRLNNDRGTVHEPFYMERAVDGTVVEVAIQYNDGFNESTFAFANCIHTIDGGTHLTGFRSALTRVLNDYARKQKILKDNDANLSGDDVREGLVAVISVKLAEPQFEGQTKTRLGNAEMKGMVESALGDELSTWLEEHPSDARRIIEKCLTAARAREAARKARDLVIKKGVLDDSVLPGKLADCSERDPENRELYIVEGAVRRRLREGGPRPPLPGDPAAARQDPQRREGAPGQDARARGDQGADHGARHRLRRGLRRRQAPLPPRHHHDRRRRRRRAHPHAAADVLLPLHAAS